MNIQTLTMVMASLFVLSLVFTKLFIKISSKKRILDMPNERSLHQIPVPRGGGLVFVSLFYVATGILWLNSVIATQLFLALLGGVPVAIIGYLDDLYQVKNKWRATVQVLSASWAIFSLGGVHTLNFGVMNLHAPISFSLLSIFITVWFINLYNFMDGIDGLASAEAIFVCATVGSILLMHNEYSISYICFVLVSVLAGFLMLNWMPAKIFMGDVGSGFLGFVLAILMWATNNTGVVSFPIWWILLAVFIADASFTLINRMLRKQKWYAAHREHAYQRIVQSGKSHARVTLGVITINGLLLFPAIELYLKLKSGISIVLYLSAVIMICLSGWLYITKRFIAK